MKILNKGTVTSAQGFSANGLAAGIKKSGKPDLSLIVSDVACPTAGVYTKNSVKAAPLVLAKEYLKNNRAQAVICNSGNANCFTGKKGFAVAQKTAALISKLLKIKTQDVIVASTGIIGKQLPFEKIKAAAPALVAGLSTHKGHLAAKGILTTDLTQKEIAVQITLGGKKVIIGGCAKGSGMIQPNMATMLCFITTDAAITSKMLKQALLAATDHSFNCISVDGCMSTNDMVSVMANGFSGNPLISSANADFQKFTQALTFICTDLAKKIVLDGEGATKFIEILVDGAKSHTQAKTIALAIANSNLVKTAAYGSNPNWGRVAAAVGSLSLGVTENTIKITFSSFAKKHIKINVFLKLGQNKAIVYTSDLSPQYVHINGKYT
ncbi:MAG: bifunctional glutamate N-acetyltransferase/amino-acid acetyltransferase ArgJ [Candidatus Omnitrophica bacterium]|nr:bifunctional glutamate N-acetyltransferase/amino-acid acetyltransferase ArgJ [Candidatus Omnitrophota bacterium]